MDIVDNVKDMKNIFGYCNKMVINDISWYN